MNEIVKLIQRQLPISQRVHVWTKDGRQISGVLAEIGKNHISIETDKGTSTILIETLSSWEVAAPPSPSDSITSLPNKTLEVVSIATNSQPDRYPNSTVTNAAFQRLVEIEARFNAHLKTERIDIEEPKLLSIGKNISENSPYKKDFVKRWDRIVNSYKHAKKVNELGEKFGRIQPITAQLESLSTQIPSLIIPQRLLGYCYYLNNRKKTHMRYLSELLDDRGKLQIGIISLPLLYI